MPYKNKLRINLMNKNIFDKIMEPRHEHNFLRYVIYMMMVTRGLKQTVTIITLEWINCPNIKRVPMVNNEWRAISPYNPICGKRIIGKKFRDSANPYKRDYFYSFIKIRCNKISTKRDISDNIIGYWRYPTITYIQVINDEFDIVIYVEICRRQQWTW